MLLISGAPGTPSPSLGAAVESTGLVLHGSAPALVSVGQHITCTLSVSNASAHQANGLWLSNSLPAAARFVAARAAEGSCWVAEDAVRCELNRLGPGEAVAVEIEWATSLPGRLTNNAAVFAAGMDEEMSDNYLSLATTVTEARFFAVGPMAVEHRFHTATRLTNGTVLVVGGEFSGVAESYDPVTLAFTHAGDLPDPWWNHSATLLLDGRVMLVAGGSSQGMIASALTYDPAAGTFRRTAGDPAVYRLPPTAVRLRDWRVLIFGGSPEVRGEMYDPATERFTLTGPAEGLSGTACLLPSGKVLLANPGPGGAHLFDPATDTVLPTGDMRDAHSRATVLADGRVLLTGGATAEVYDPRAGVFTLTGTPLVARIGHTATLLANGQVLVAGGSANLFLASAELYDPPTGTFQWTASLNTAREGHTATRLSDGTVLIAGGLIGYYVGLDNAELYDPNALHDPPGICVCDASTTEGDGGTNRLWFPVQLTHASDRAVRVNWRTVEGTARTGWRPADRDFVSSSGVLTFAPGVTNVDVAVAVLGDRLHEKAESLRLVLSQPTCAYLADDSAQGTILNDDPPPELSVSSETIIEPDTGLATLVFTVGLSTVSALTVWVDYQTADQSAVADSDYLPVSGTLAFFPDETNKTIAVAVIGELETEPDEVFSLVLTNARNATLATGQGNATVINNDGFSGRIHHFDVAPAGITQLQNEPFTVTVTARDVNGTLVPDFAGPVRLAARTTNVIAANLDFEQPHLAPWTPLQTSDLPGPYELAAFDVDGDGRTSTAFRTLTGSGRDGITQDIWLAGGETYTISVNLAASLEGHGCWGGGDAAWLELAETKVGWNLPGLCGGQVARETLTLPFTPPTNGLYPLRLTFSRGYAADNYATYADDLQVCFPLLTPTVVTNFVNGSWSGPVTVGQGATNMALLADDGLGHRGESAPILVLPRSDLVLQASLSPARVGSNLVVSLTVRNDGPSSATGVVLTNLLEGDLTWVSFESSQGACSNLAGTVWCDLGRLTPGQTATARLTGIPRAIGVLTNVAFVSAWVVETNLANNSARSELTVAPPTLVVRPATVDEPEAGTSTVDIAVELDGPSGQTISVDYTTASGSAAAGSDFLTAAGQLVFPAGVQTQWVTVQVVGDTLDEPNESFTLNLSNAINAGLGQGGAGVATITDNDPPVTVSIGDAVVTEGNSGTTPAVFPVMLSQPSGFTVNVTWGTANGTAVAGSDFVQVSAATLSFPPGTISNAAVVSVRGNTVNESNESFYVNLGPAANATVVDGIGLGTIVDDDQVAGQLDHFEWSFIPPWQSADRPIDVTVVARDPFNGLVSNFFGNVNLTATARTGAVNVTVYPGVLRNFSNGVWTGTVRVLLTNVQVVLKADDGQEHVGLSSPFNVIGRFPLLLSVPSSATEGDGVLAGQGRLTTTIAQSNDVTINLTSSRPAQLAVPASVLLPAGQTSTVFDATVVDDMLLNGSRSVSLVASAVDHASSSATMVLHDNESATLELALPANVTEGAGFLVGAGTVRASAAPAVDIAVALVSSDTTELQVPATVILPAGQTSALFHLTVPNDAFIDGPQPATVSAHVEHWTDGLAVVLVLDNESTNLVLQTPARFAEGSGTATNAGLLSISGTFETNLVVSLASSDPSELIVPATVVIPAGQTNARFNLTVVDDSDFDGVQTMTVSATAAGLRPASSVLRVDDNDVHHFGFAPIPTLQTATIPFAVSISALDIQEAVVRTFSGTAALSASGNRGPMELLPTNAIFQTGQWTGAVTVAYWDAGVRLAARIDRAEGWSNPFDAVVPTIQMISLPTADLICDPFAQRLYASVPATGGALSNRVVVIDPVIGRVESSFYVGDNPGKLALSDDGQLLYVACTPQGEYGTNWVRRFVVSSRTQDLEIPLGSHSYYLFTYFASDLAPLPGSPRSVAVAKATAFLGYYPEVDIFDDGVQRSNTLPPVVPQFPMAIEAASATRLYAATYFTRMTLDASGVRSYDVHEGLMGFLEDMKLRGGLIWSASGKVFDPESLVVFGSLPQCTQTEPDLAQGKVFTLTRADQPWIYVPWTLRACDAVSLRALGSLEIPGVGDWAQSLVRWGTNGLAFRTTRDQVFLIRTPLVPTEAPVDLSIAALANPDPVTLTSNLTCTLVITNLSSNAVPEVELTDRLPLGVTFVSASASQGSHVVSNGVLICAMGALPAGAQASVTFVVRPNLIAPALTNVAWVSAGLVDVQPTNNRVVTVTALEPVPVCSASDVTLEEGNVGIRDFVFTLDLSAASQFRISVDITTAGGGLAVAGSDFLSTAGTVVFPPGVTSQPVVVQVLCDTVAEMEEQFAIQLQNPVFATLSRPYAMGTILNDDGLAGRIDHFDWSPLAPTQFAEKPIPMELTARDADGAVVTNFAGPVTFSSAFSDPVTVDGAFDRGIWRGAVSVGALGTNVYLQADDGDGHFGHSLPFNIESWEDADTDGMEDGWEQRYFGGINTVDGNAAVDADRDGLTNLEEFLAGTHPRDPQSVLQLLTVRFDGPEIRIAFTTAPGKHYQLETADLPGGQWTTVLDSLWGIGGPMEVTDAGGARPVRRFYRIRLQPGP